jgi:hypothetical protein
LRGCGASSSMTTAAPAAARADVCATPLTKLFAEAVVGWTAEPWCLHEAFAVEPRRRPLWPIPLRGHRGSFTVAHGSASPKQAHPPPTTAC